MSQKARKNCIEEFSCEEENSPTVMLLSLKAGGEGISLIAASKIFLLTPVTNVYRFCVYFTCGILQLSI
jgi:SWI/SNF-related matrix-associated actin-dependent regulator of chromatin subfamily A3